MSEAAGDRSAAGGQGQPRLSLAVEPPAYEPTAAEALEAETNRRRDAEAALGELHRRVLELEAAAVAREATIRSLQRELEEQHDELATTYAAVSEHWPRSQELAALHATKTFRWTSRPRQAYSQLLRRRGRD